MSHFLESFLWPQGIAIVGAAPTGKHRTRGQLVRYLVGVGYEGAIYPINPSYQDVDGRRCYPTLMDVGAPIDVAVLALPAALIEAEVENCGRAGVKFAVILSAGFIEAGATGAALQQAILDAARRGGVRLMGPNCQGYYNVPGKVTTTFSPTVAPAANPPYLAVAQRRAAIVAQSGGIGYSLYTRGRAAGLAFSHVISVGNEADLTTADFLDYLVQDTHTAAIILFAETVRQPERFVTALAAARRAGKPVIMLKVGRSAAAQRAAASHTAALTGWDTGYRAVFERHNVVQVDHPDEAIAVAGAFLTCPLPRGARAAVVTVSGGGGALMADTLAANGIAIPALGASLQAAINAYIPGHGAADNPIDLTLNSADLVMPTLELLEQSDEVDLIVMASQLASAEILPIDVPRMRAIMDRQRKPVITWTYTLPSPAAQQVTAESGMMVCLNLHDAGRSVGALVRYALAQQGIEAAAPVAAARPAPRDTRRVVTEYDTRRMLAAFGLHAAPEGLAHSAAEARALADGIGYPVVLKVQSADIPHKTEAGGVALNLADAEAVAAAYERILAAARRWRAAARIDGVLVQAMAPKGYEVVVGMVNDANFGPIMMVGLGGIAIELFGDVVHAPAPVSVEEARAMLKKLKSAPLFDGFRGAPAVDTGPVAELVALASRFALAQRDQIAEMEFNPVILHADGSGATVADALMILKDGVAAADLTPRAPALQDSLGEARDPA